MTMIVEHAARHVASLQHDDVTVDPAPVHIPARRARPGKQRLVVVGNGMAGIRTVEEILAVGGAEKFTITVFGDEPYGNYNRILLSNVLAGVDDESEIFLNPLSWYEENDIDLRAGVRVVDVDPHSKFVEGADGSVTPYDKLILATGSYSFIPPIKGIRTDDGELKPGVFGFRTLDDCREIAGHAAQHERGVVIGGGLLGLEAARGLQGHGVDVTVVHADKHLMNTQLDSEAGRILTRNVESIGVKVVLAGMTTAVCGDDRVTGVELSDGTVIPADMVVVTAGIRPYTELAIKAGLDVERAIVVDDHMRSVDNPDIYAVGECAQHRGQVYGLVAPLWEQGVVLAKHITEVDTTAAYHGSRLATKLKVAGVNVASMGVKEPERDDDEFVRFSEPKRGVYKSVVIRDGKLVGATLLGDVDKVAFLMQAFDRGLPLPEERV